MLVTKTVGDFILPSAIGQDIFTQVGPYCQGAPSHLGGGNGALYGSGGRGGAYSTFRGKGGASGIYSKKLVAAASCGTTETVTIGAGGAGGNNSGFGDGQAGAAGIVIVTEYYS